MLLEGKNAIITGANRGIGKAIAEVFASEGSNIWVCARLSGEEFETWAKALGSQYGVRVEPIYFDLVDEGAIKEGVKSIRSFQRPIDILVNNAGAMCTPTSFQMTDIQRFRDTFEVNFYGPMILTQFVSRLMARKGQGSIVNIASITGLDSAPGQTEYGASKAALVLATKKLASEFAPMGIRVNAIAPGIIETDMGSGVPREITQDLIRVSALSRMGLPKEVANAVAFMASDFASYITGQTLRVDGGAYLAIDRI